MFDLEALYFYTPF